MRVLISASVLALSAAAATAAVVNTTDNAVIDISAAQTESSNDKATPAVLVGGDDVTVDNSGVIAQQSDDKGGYALEFTGDNPRLRNSGLIRSGDRGMEQTDGTGLRIENSGTIESRRQAVRAGAGRVGATLINSGVVTSEKGRAVQFRAAGAHVENTGALRGGEEVVEAREDFSIVNSGLIALNGLSWDGETVTNDGATDDEDGVQFASGRVDNYGTILATDDGVDIDEGVVHNHKTGVIVTVGPVDDASKGGVDVDAEFAPGVGDKRAAGKLTVINEGRIEGGRAVAFEETSAAPFELRNSGVLIGRSGVAAAMAATQGESLVALSGASQVFGDILFGAGDRNTLALGVFAEGASMAGDISAQAGGTFSVMFDPAVAREDLLSGVLRNDLFLLTMRAGAGSVTYSLSDPASFAWGGVDYGAQGFAAYLSGAPAPVPTPAALPMLLAGLGGLAFFRRRA